MKIWQHDASRTIVIASINNLSIIQDQIRKHGNYDDHKVDLSKISENISSTIRDSKELFTKNFTSWVKNDHTFPIKKEDIETLRKECSSLEFNTFILNVLEKRSNDIKSIDREKNKISQQIKDISHELETKDTNINSLKNQITELEKENKSLDSQINKYKDLTRLNEKLKIEINELKKSIYRSKGGLLLLIWAIIATLISVVLTLFLSQKPADNLGYPNRENEISKMKHEIDSLSRIIKSFKEIDLTKIVPPNKKDKEKETTKTGLILSIPELITCSNIQESTGQNTRDYGFPLDSLYSAFKSLPFSSWNLDYYKSGKNIPLKFALKYSCSSAEVAYIQLVVNKTIIINKDLKKIIKNKITKTTKDFCTKSIENYLKEKYDIINKQ